MKARATFDNFRELQKRIARNMAVLAGDELGPAKCTWQDVTVQLAKDMQAYAFLLDAARTGRAEPFLTFPSLAETMEENEHAS
jgi:hypothetical protein